MDALAGWRQAAGGVRWCQRHVTVPQSQTTVGWCHNKNCSSTMENAEQQHGCVCFCVFFNVLWYCSFVYFYCQPLRSLVVDSWLLQQDFETDSYDVTVFLYIFMNVNAWFLQCCCLRWCWLTTACGCSVLQLQLRWFHFSPFSFCIILLFLAFVFCFQN